MVLHWTRCVTTLVVLASLVGSLGCSTCTVSEPDDSPSPAMLVLTHLADFLTHWADEGTTITADGGGLQLVHDDEGLGCGAPTTDAGVPDTCVLSIQRVSTSIGASQPAMTINIDGPDTPAYVYVGAAVNLDAPAKPGHYSLADLHATLCDTVCVPIGGTIDVQSIAMPCGSGACGRVEADVTFEATPAPSNAAPVLTGTAHLHYAESLTQTFCGGGPGLMD